MTLDAQTLALFFAIFILGFFLGLMTVASLNIQFAQALLRSKLLVPAKTKWSEE